MSTYIKQTLAADVAIDIEQNMEVVLNSSTDFNKTYTADSGVTVLIRKPDFGADLTSGIDVSAATATVVQDSVSVTLAAKSAIVTISSLEESVEAGNVQEMVVAPRMSNMGSQVQKEHLAKMFLNIGAAKIVSSGTGDYKHVGDIGAMIDASRITGDNYFATSPKLATEIKQSGLAYFQASTLDKTFSSRAMGDVDGIKCMRTPDISTISVLAKTLGASTVPKVKTKVATEGATGFIIKVAGGTATFEGGVVVGEVITIDGYYGVDIYGNATTELFPFVSQTAVTASGNEIAFVCQPIYFTGPNKNVSIAIGTGIAADAVVTFAMGLVAATYKKGIIWKKPAVIFANRALAKIKGFDNTMINTIKGVQMLQTDAGDAKTGQNSIIWRMLYGSAIAYCQGLAGLFVKV